MKRTLHVLLSPADYQAAARSGFAGKACVVFDVLRATSVMVTGLAYGVVGFLPVSEIADAVAARTHLPGSLLAGERGGLRINASQSGGVEFDLGNSPREFRSEKVRETIVITTTTNGTRAIRCCETASKVAVASFLNLGATSRWLQRHTAGDVILVCAGTGDLVAFEDVMAAGALCERLAQQTNEFLLSDAAQLARCGFRASAGNLYDAVIASANGRRLWENPELRDDVEFCLRNDAFDLVGVRGADGIFRSVAGV